MSNCTSSANRRANPQPGWRAGRARRCRWSRHNPPRNGRRKLCAPNRSTGSQSMNPHRARRTPWCRLAVGRRSCNWRNIACTRSIRPDGTTKVLFTSWSATGVARPLLFPGWRCRSCPNAPSRPGMRMPVASRRVPFAATRADRLMKRPGRARGAGQSPSAAIIAAAPRQHHAGWERTRSRLSAPIGLVVAQGVRGARTWRQCPAW